MNILIISTQNPYKTSGIVAYSLYKGSKDYGNNTKMLIKSYDDYKMEDVFYMETPLDIFIDSWKKKCKGLLNKLGFIKLKKVTNPDYHVQDYNQTIEIYKTKNILKKINFKPDVIIYLFQQNFLTAKNLYELNTSTGAKIYWYLMDSAPLTGACHYSWNCYRYINGCGKCPALYSDNERDQSYTNLKYKIHYLNKTDIEIIVASEWQKKHAKASYLFKNTPIHKVLLSVDPKIFSYVPKNQAKEKLYIPNEKRVIFFGATSINTKRKGMKYLVDALRILYERGNKENEDIMLLIAGRSTTLFDTLHYEKKHLGFLANNEQLASAFQAADVFVCPSIEDSGPLMINQSIMTGTPVVAFEMGVASDLVHCGETGYKAKIKDSTDLAKGINDILELDKKAYNQLCLNCNEMGNKLLQPEKINQQLIKIFNS